MELRHSLTLERMSHALFAWLRRASGTARVVETPEDCYDGEVLYRAFERAVRGTEDAETEDEEVDFIQKLSGQLTKEGVRDGTAALRARDARGTMRLVREMYAESLRRRISAFAVDRERAGGETADFARASPRARAKREERVTATTTTRTSGEFEVEENDFEYFEDGDADMEEDVDAADELDMTHDWLTLASPSPRGSNRDRTSPASSPSPRSAFVSATDMLRELNLNEGVRSGREPKTLTRTPPPVPKTLRLWKSESPIDRSRKSLKWEIIFDEDESKTMRRLVPSSDERGGGTSTRSRLQVAAERRGRLTWSSERSPRTHSASSPERRRSDIGVAPCYVPARAPSNKRIIRSALRSLLGPPDMSEACARAVRAVDSCEHSTIVLLLKDIVPRKLRGVYAVVAEDALVKIYGSGPEFIETAESSSVAELLKYDTVSTTFECLPGNSRTPTVTAITLAR